MTAPAPAQPAPPLPYAPPARWHRRRGFRTLLGASVLLALCGSGAIAWRHHAPRLRPRLEMLSAQRACLNHQAPPDTVVLTRGADETFGRGWFLFSTKFKKTRGGNRAWEHFHNTYVSRIDDDGSKTLLTSDGTVFLHERRSPGGNRRLVAVDLQMSWHRRHTKFNAAARVTVPGTLRADPETVFAGPATDDLGNPRAAQRRDLLTARYGTHVTFFAGQPDPADASRFTIVYEIDGRRETIDGWLRDDDAVELLQRNPPRPDPPLTPVVRLHVAGASTQWRRGETRPRIPHPHLGRSAIDTPRDQWCFSKSTMAGAASATHSVAVYA